MHMADALISPAVGGAGWLAAAALTVHSARQVRRNPDRSPPALMGVLGAFVFAAQMVNFSIPGTGSSGHLGGGLLLAALLGPHAGFLVLASVLTVQALMFADGGLLALGCNIVNIGAFTCFIAYPLLFRTLAGSRLSPRRTTFAALAAGVVGLQLGAFAVVVETTLSDIAQLPFETFTWFMLPIHLAIGVVEGLVTAAVLLYVWHARPDLFQQHDSAKRPLGRVLWTFAAAALVTGGALSWFASSDPDGLEWATWQSSGEEELAAPQGALHTDLAEVQEKTSLLPDYDFAESSDATEATWPNAQAGSSVSGVLGGVIVLLLALGLGAGLRALRARGKGDRPSDSNRSSDLAHPLA